MILKVAIITSDYKTKEGGIMPCISLCVFAGWLIMEPYPSIYMAYYGSQNTCEIHQVKG